MAWTLRLVSLSQNEATLDRCEQNSKIFLAISGAFAGSSPSLFASNRGSISTISCPDFDHVLLLFHDKTNFFEFRSCLGTRRAFTFPLISYLTVCTRFTV